MSDDDAEEFEKKAIEGDWRAAVTVLGRSSVKAKVLAALMTDDAHDEVRIALASRNDVTVAQIRWIAQADNPFILNRLLAHPKTPVDVVMGIRERAQQHDSEAWRLLDEYAARVLDQADSAS